MISSIECKFAFVAFCILQLENPLDDTLTTIQHALVLLVEDEPLLQERLLKTLVELGAIRENVRVADSLATANRMISQEPFVLAFVDLFLPDGNGMELIRRLRESGPDACILVGSAWSSSAVLFEALSAGASGYVLKERDDADLLFAMRCALRGGATIDPALAREILQHMSAGQESSEATTLSPNQMSLLRLTTDGWTNREIAQKLGLNRVAIERAVLEIYQLLHRRTLAK